MAIHPTLSPGQGTLTPQQAIDISVWTDQAAQSLQAINLSATESVNNTPSARGRSASLTIPLDSEHPTPGTPTPLRLKSVRVDAPPVVATYGRREPIRRDSLKRREALLKGKEGSRRRQRWENDRLLNNPWAQAPSAHDWQIQPTYPRHGTCPYYLAHLWEARLAAREHKHSAKNKSASSKTAANESWNQIPKELRMRLKHARAARGMLQDLEEDIRNFLQQWAEKQEKLQGQGPEDQTSSNTQTGVNDEDDDEDVVVFVGRKAQAKDPIGQKQNQRKPSEDKGASQGEYGEKLIFESLEDDQGAGFGRWLVHSLAQYYGLRTWSVTVGNPPRREAYVGIDHTSLKLRSTRNTVRIKSGHHGPMVSTDGMLPRPLWVSV
ncbi:hypothetical protein AJ80_09207 [Polytolypa hystricis UAMH7299]|uniref:R3H-associated N-terminal domain-containing protein n=1 Tax=Polytolypa hystricis (strain UAMH7299) TaxID=1447883 RepID=A0A2B7WUC3_POLH7|nr:hypothetical protein AJ80_09207 [Polytolypa hystricis UAMH7299]